MARRIIERFPPHTCYVEPFGGGGSVLLRKAPSTLEVYNDLNGDVVNFFRVLRSRPADLIAAIGLTPYSRQEFREAQNLAGVDDLERARRFFVWSWQGRGRAGVAEPGGWRFMSRMTRGTAPVGDFDNIAHLWAVVDRLKKVQIECDDALKVIARYDTPETLFYLDPPYLAATRGQRWSSGAYVLEYTDDDHCRLAERLHGLAGMAIVSGYPSALYEGLYAGWACVQWRGIKDNGAKETVECLWLSPNIKSGGDL